MSIEVGDYICRYTLDGDKIEVQEAEVFECGPRKYVQFNAFEAPVKAPRTADLGRVWKDGKTLWLAVRDDERARGIFVDYGIRRIRDLRAEIKDVEDHITFLRGYMFESAEIHREVRSRCFGGDDIPKKKKKNTKDKGVESLRRYRNAYEAGEFINPKQYIERKLEMLKKEMLKKEMCICVTDGEVSHLRTLTTQSAIDAAVRSIIDRHW